MRSALQATSTPLRGASALSIRLLVVSEEMMTDAMAVEDESHVLGVADELERTED